MNFTKAPIELRQRGFTLVELVIAMGLFLVVIAIAGKSFNNIYSLSSRFSKSEETNIEGVIGLEVMRHDLEQTGFGLPWGFGSAITYQEAADGTGATLNDAPSSAPRAFVGVASYSDFAANYFSVKAATVGTTKTSQRWSYIPYHNISTASGRLSQPVLWQTNNLQSGDKVIVVRSDFNDPTDDHLLIVSSGVFSSAYSASFAADYLPATDQQTHVIYGIDTVTPRMPFNRADYFVSASATAVGSPPPFCAPGTGVLYKASVSQLDGSYLYIPLLNCVADMRVVLGWDTSDQGNANSINAYSSVPASDGTLTVTPAAALSSITGCLATARGIREHLKLVKVYVLAQEGKRDASYTAPSNTIVVGNDDEQSLTHVYPLTAAQKQYRWRLYRIIARPKNLLSNQR